LNNFITAGVALISAKFLVIITSMTMAVIAVGLDAQKHTLPSALFAIFAGTVIGVVAAVTLVALFGWSESVGYGVASIASISGNNLVKWLLRVSQDPTSLLRLWWNRGGKE